MGILKIYVSVDLEGIAGVVSRSQLFFGEPHYQEARGLLTDEVNAVVEGLQQAGVEEIIVKDAHGTGFNLLIDKIHPGATYTLGGTDFDQRFPGLDESFDGAMLIGYHAMAGSTRAILDHTYSSKTYTKIELNGQAIGEVCMDGLLFGQYGVPILFVSGDDKTCAEAKQELGDAVTVYQTKTATGRHSALIKPPRRVNVEIKAAVAEAIARKELCKPNKKLSPYELIVHFVSSDLADARYCDGIETIRLDGLSILYKDTNLIRLCLKAL